MANVISISPVEVVLPIPPSVNGVWKKGPRGMYLSPEYKTWISEASRLAKIQRVSVQDVTGLGPPPYRVEIHVCPGPKGKGWRVNRDLDNIGKAVLDLISKRLGLLPGDDSRVIRYFGVELHDDGDVPHVAVEIQQYRGARRTTRTQVVPTGGTECPEGRLARETRGPVGGTEEDCS